MGATVKCVPLHVLSSGARAGAWALDMDALLSAITPATRMLVVNAPNNPTGWTLTRDEQATMLAHCRRTGTWILADEVYERLYYAGDTANGAAPSFLDVAEPDDRVIVAHSFSKSFLMTGWRLGWLVLPAALTAALGKLIEFNTSCAPVFVQRGATVALQRGAEVTPALVAHLKTCRDTLVPLLRAVPGVTLAEPPQRLPGRGETAGARGRHWPGAGQRLQPGGVRLAALVLRQPRHPPAGRGRLSPAPLDRRPARWPRLTPSAL